MKTRVVVFPFDLFGAAGSGAGAELLADELREMLADNRRETTPTRAHAYTEQVRIRQTSFETADQYQTWREQGRKLARQVIHEGEFLIWLSGNHLGCLPVYDVLSSLATPPLVIQFDAHLDIHQFAGYSAEPSHGNFLLHCEKPLPPLINLGHRELLLTPDQIKKTFVAAHASSTLAIDSRAVLKSMNKAISAADTIFLDLDCDVIDPAYFPAVARPVPFGLTPPQLLALIEAVWSKKVSGLLISEFDPARDQNDQSLSALAWLLEYLLLKIHEGLQESAR